MSARDEILARIRRAVPEGPGGAGPEGTGRAGAGHEPAVHEPAVHEPAGHEPAGSTHADGAPGAYRVTGTLDDAARLALFEERIRDYGVRLTRSTEDALRVTIGRVLEDRGIGRVVVPAGVPAAWLPDGVTVAADTPDPLTADALAAVDGVLTTCAVAIAETGTLALDAAAGQGRRALTLVPDYHLCVVRADQVVQTVPEAVRRLEDRVRAGAPITLVSGPSATSDIELRRVSGVHGPRTLDVILVAAP